MGRGLRDAEDSLLPPTAIPLARIFRGGVRDALSAIERVEREGWPVHSGYADPSTLVAWDAQAAVRRIRRAELSTVGDLAAAAYTAAVREGWVTCITEAPAAYARRAALSGLADEEMRSWMTAAATSGYDLHCVLGGSPATFGVEIEFAGALRPAAEALFELGLAEGPEVWEPTAHGHNRPTGWTVKPDDTVRPSGGEVTSPVLLDLPASWEQLARVCAVLRDLGATVNRSCGLHVHVGADRLAGDVRAYLRLFLLGRAYEDLLYRLAASGGDMRHRGTAYDAPIAGRTYRPTVGSIREFRQEIGAQAIDAMNFTNVGSAKNTVEFRYGNGTLDHERIQQLAVVYVGLIEAARRSDLRLQDLPVTPLGTLAREAAASDRSVRSFCDTVFPTNNRAKLAVLKLYQQGRWQQAPGETERTHVRAPVGALRRAALGAG